MVSLHCSSKEFRFRSKVIIGLAGIDTSSVQFLYSVTRAKGLESVDCNLSMNCRPALQLIPDQPHLPPVLLFNDDEESYVLINMMLPPTECVEFVSGCFAFINSCFDGDFVDVGHLIVLASLRIKQKLNSEGPLMMYLNQEEHDKKNNIENFPNTYPISDAMLSTWLHFAKAIKVKTTGVLLPSYQLPINEALPSPEEANAKYASGIHDLIALPVLKAFRFERNAWHDDTRSDGMFYT